MLNAHQMFIKDSILSCIALQYVAVAVSLYQTAVYDINFGSDSLWIDGNQQ